VSTTARTATGDLQLPRIIVTDIAQVARQTIIDGLSLWESEWFLDQNAGFPWAQRVFGIKNPNQVQIAALLRQFLLSVPNVVTATATIFLNGAQRAFSYTFSANLANGQKVTGATGQLPQVTGSP
jgi:hypothetical protein